MGDGYLWLTNKYTQILLSQLHEMRNIYMDKLEGIGPGEEYTAPSLASVVRTIRSIEEGIVEIAKEDNNNNEETGDSEVSEH